MDMRLQTLLLSCALFPASQSQVIASGPKDPAAKALNQTAKAQSPLLKKAVLGCTVVGSALLAAFLAWTVYKNCKEPHLDSERRNSPSSESRSSTRSQNPSPGRTNGPNSGQTLPEQARARRLEELSSEACRLRSQTDLKYAAVPASTTEMEELLLRWQAELDGFRQQIPLCEAAAADLLAAQAEEARLRAATEASVARMSDVEVVLAKAMGSLAEPEPLIQEYTAARGKTAAAKHKLQSTGDPATLKTKVPLLETQIRDLTKLIGIQKQIDELPAR